MEGKYEYIKIKPAENGWVLCYDEYMKNPMTPESTYGYDGGHFMQKKLVFESDGSEKGMEKALDDVLAAQKEMLLENREEMLEHSKKSESHNSHGPKMSY